MQQRGEGSVLPQHWTSSGPGPTGQQGHQLYPCSTESLNLTQFKYTLNIVNLKYTQTPQWLVSVLLILLSILSAEPPGRVLQTWGESYQCSGPDLILPERGPVIAAISVVTVAVATITSLEVHVLLQVDVPGGRLLLGHAVLHDPPVLRHLGADPASRISSGLTELVPPLVDPEVG